MKVIRTRTAAALLASSAILASGATMTAIAVTSAGPAAAAVVSASGLPGPNPCPNATLIEACANR